MGLNYPLGFALGAATGVGFLPIYEDDEPEPVSTVPPQRVDEAEEKVAMQYAKTYYHRNLWELTPEEREGCRVRARRYLGS